MSSDLSAFFKKPSTTLALSILMAVVGWFVVVYSISPSDTAELSGVPVRIELPATSALNVVEGQDATVNVKIEGMRYNIGNLRSNEIVLRADLGDVDQPGTYELTVTAVKPADNRYEVISIFPETIAVTFDREVTKTIVIEQDITGLEVPGNSYLLGDMTIEPGTVTVQGPEKEVSRIHRAVVTQAFDEPVTSSQTLELPIVFTDSNGSEIKTKASGDGYITASADRTTVNVPVMDVVELPLTLSFINVPDDFPLDQLKYSISNEIITVAATYEVISRYFEIPVGRIDLSLLDLSLQSSMTFNIELPDDMINYNNIESVVVEFDQRELEAKTLRIREIDTLNVPPNYNVEIKTGSLSAKMIGDGETIEALLPEAVVAEIDFSSQEIMTGQYSMPVKIYLPNDSFAWAIGKYTAVVNVTEK